MTVFPIDDQNSQSLNEQSKNAQEEVIDGVKMDTEEETLKIEPNDKGKPGIIRFFLRDKLFST